MGDLHFYSIAGKAAGVIALAGFIPYILSTVRGKNKPNRATWIIWGIVSVILLMSYKEAGATHSLWTSYAHTLGMGLIVLISFKYGEGGWNLMDGLCLLGAGLGLFFWWRFHSPLPALYLSVAVDFIGAIPTLKKSYHRPEGENYLTWVLFFTANTLNLFSLEEWSLKMALYPLYLSVISAVLLGVLTVQRRRVA